VKQAFAALGDQVTERRTAGRVGHRRNHTGWLIQHQGDLRPVGLDWQTINFDPAARRVNPQAQFPDPDPINCHPARLNHRLRVPPGGQAGFGQDLLQPDAVLVIRRLTVLRLTVLWLPVLWLTFLWLTFLWLPGRRRTRSITAARSAHWVAPELWRVVFSASAGAFGPGRAWRRKLTG
jgi:hypothetical protein